jgi:hypothetical protein|tara:strand:- start:38 stop:199 length:162 start_codon:yes stop_codon:yes gene_type:complete
MIKQKRLKMNKAFVIKSPKFYGHYAVQLPDGEVVDCANLRTAIDTATLFNRRS